MSPYIPEPGIALPPSNLAHPRVGPKAKRSALSQAMDALAVGESFALPTEDEYDQARARAWMFRPRKFATRRHGAGWRVWRTE